MLVGRVTQHLVDDDLKAQRVSTLDQGVEIFEAPEKPVDLLVVGHVVAHVRLRRLEKWRKPDGIDTEARDVVEAAQHTRQVADSIAVRVLK
jgi:hypothetical protein